MSSSENLRDASVLITGGSQGIGLGLAARYVAAGSRVLITGRNQDRLADASTAHPGLKTFRNDIGTAAGREELAAYAAAEMPNLQIVINNAGIQRRLSLAEDTAPWSERFAEVDLLLGAPVHLNSLLIPMMLKSSKPALIVNVTSGGAFIPQPFAPIYSASKAALHSYTLTLRHALAGTNIRVVELAPPAVKTRLVDTAPHGADLEEFVAAVFPAINAQDAKLVGFGPTSSPELDAFVGTQDRFFDAFSNRFPIVTYASTNS